MPKLPQRQQEAAAADDDDDDADELEQGAARVFTIQL